MRKWIAVLLAMLLLAALSCVALAEEDAPFDATLFEEYKDANWKRLQSTYYWEFEDDFWLYQIYQDATSATAKETLDLTALEVVFGIRGWGMADGVPFVLLCGSSPQEIAFSRLDILVGDRVYTVDASKVSKFHSGEMEDGVFELYATYVLGTEGIQLFHDLQAQGGKFTMRAFHTNKEYIEIEPKTPHNYKAFYEGLQYSHFMNAEGNISPTTQRALTAIDKDRKLPNITSADRSDKIWPVITPAPTLLVNLNKDDLAQYEPINVGDKSDHILDIRMRMYELGYFSKVPTQTEFTKGMVEFVNAFQAQNGLPVENVITPEMQALLFSEHALAVATATPRPTATPKPTPTPYVEPTIALTQTKTADWARSNGVAWFKIQVKNVSETATIERVGVLYHCKDKEEAQITNTLTGDTHTLAWVDTTVKPGRTVMTGKVKAEGYADVAYVWCTLYGYVLSDGTEVILPERDQVFWGLRY